MELFNKLNKIKLYIQFLSCTRHFKCSIATSGSWSLCWTALIQNHCRKFYPMVLLYIILLEWSYSCPRCQLSICRRLTHLYSVVQASPLSPRPMWPNSLTFLFGCLKSISSPICYRLNFSYSSPNLVLECSFSHQSRHHLIPGKQDRKFILCSPSFLQSISKPFEWSLKYLSNFSLSSFPVHPPQCIARLVEKSPWIQILILAKWPWRSYLTFFP